MFQQKWVLVCSGPSWISARVRSHYRTDLNGPVGSPVFACAGKTDPPSLLILSQTSAGKSCQAGYVIADSSFHIPVFNNQTDWAVAIDPASKPRPRASTDQAMRASLLASAIA